MKHLAIALAVAACGGTSSTPSPAGGVYGWWAVPEDPAAEDVGGGSLKLTPDEMIALTKDGELYIRPCKTTLSGDGTTGSITGCGPEGSVKLAGDQLTITDRKPFTVTRIAADRAAKLDAELAAKRPPADTCDRARTCFRDGMKAIGQEVTDATVETEFRGTGPTDCQKTIAAVKDIVAEKGVAPPASCK